MKNTIREELSEKYLRASLINDNALVIYTESEKSDYLVDVKIRYIKGNTIKEDCLTSITFDDFKRKRNRLIKVNDEKTEIIIMKSVDNSYQLDKIYSLETYYFEAPYLLQQRKEQPFDKKEKEYFKEKR